MIDEDRDDKDFDVCIVGTGAGGGVLSYRLAKAGLRVLTLDAGPLLPSNYFTEVEPPFGKEFFHNQSEKELPANSNDKPRLHPLFSSELDRGSVSTDKDGCTPFHHFQIFAVNGLQNLWNGISVRFSKTDFEQWPISYEDLEPYYASTEKLITVCGTKENIDDLPDGIFVPPKSLRKADRLLIQSLSKLRYPDTHLVPTRKAVETRDGLPNSCVGFGFCTEGCPSKAIYNFSSRLLPKIEHLPNFHLEPDCRVVEVVSSSDGTKIDAVIGLDTKTKEHRVFKARYFVLSAGAMETPRILLNSSLQKLSDCIGHFLQDNPTMRITGSLSKLWKNSQAEDKGFGDHLLIHSRNRTDDGKDISVCGTVMHSPLLKYSLYQLRSIPRWARTWYVNRFHNSFVTLALFSGGQAQRESRIVRSEEKDEFGVNRIALHYLPPLNKAAAVEYMSSLGRSLLKGASGVFNETTIGLDGDGIHYSGTCRMANDRRAGVVDRTLKVFGYSNLFIADGSVIPELPAKHSALTIMALADRLSGTLTALCTGPSSARTK